MSRIKSMVFNDQMEYLEDILEESLNEASAAKQIEINQLGKENGNQESRAEKSQITTRNSRA
jgi:hypothetical protein